jgi:endonuclease VIII
MPEGDAVWLTARRLHEALAGRALTRSDVRVPRYATTNLTGRRVTEAVSRGKHLLVRVDGGVTVHTRLGMDGSVRVRPARDRLTESHHIRLILANDSWQAVGYRLPGVEITPTAAEGSVVGHLGPDLLGPDWDPAEAVRRLLASPATPIGEALLDQGNLAGIGNIYRAEVLFLRGISPWRPTGDVPGLGELVSLAQRLLAANAERGPIITTGNARRGEELWVYGRAGRPCRRCGTPVRTAGQGGDARERVTFWCPRCQP